MTSCICNTKVYDIHSDYLEIFMCLGKFYFTRDPRLKNRNVYEFSQEELLEFAKVLTLPIFVTKTKQGSYYESKQNFYDFLDVVKNTSVDFEFHYVNGKHHMHLNNPQDVAPLLDEFIARYSGADRSLGGIPNDIVANKTYNKTLLR